MLGETVHAYILTPALAIALPRLRTLPRLVAVAGGRLSNPQLSQWDVEISRLTALVACFQPDLLGSTHYVNDIKARPDARAFLTLISSTPERFLTLMSQLSSIELSQL